MRRTRFEAIGVLSLLATAAAAETVFEPTVSISETYASNIALAPRGAERHDWISEVRPGFALRRDAPRFSYDLDYELQALFYKQDGDRDDVFHDFIGTGSGELIEDRLFLDLGGRYDQRNIDPANRQATSNLFDTDNRTDVASLSISPWLQQPIGERANATARYTWYKTDYRNSDDTSGNIQDSDTTRIDLGLSTPESARWIWRLDYFTTEVDYDEAVDFQYERGGGEFGVPVAPRSQALLAAGRESNLEEGRDNGGLDETWWTVGWRWLPTSRQTLELRVGDRYFGNTYDVIWRRSGTRGELGLEYHEAATTSNALEFGGAPVAPGSGYGDTRIDTRAYLSKRLAGLLTWETSRSDWRLRIYRDARDFVGDAEPDDDFTKDEEVLGIRADWRWQAFARTSLATGVWWEEQELEQGDANGGQLSVALIRRISRTLEGRLAVFRLLKNSEVIDDYRDTSATLELTWSPR